MKRLLTLFATILLGCSGSVETNADSGASSGSSVSSGTGTPEPDPCAPSNEMPDSNAAMAQMHCAFPTYTRLQFLSSSGGGDLDPLGRSSSWNILLRDDATNLVVHAAVSPTGVMTDAEPKPSLCAGYETIALDSAVVVPDAIKRFAVHDPYVGGSTNYMLWQASPCPDSGEEGVANVMILHTTNDGTPQDPMHTAWHAYYDSASKFIKLCGPCSANPTDNDCTPCFK